MTDILNEARKALRPEDIDHHESDLYLRVTPESKKLIDSYDYKNLVSKFIDNIDHVFWYDIPFAFHD